MLSLHRLFAHAGLALALLGCAKDPASPDATTSVTGKWLATDTVQVFTGFNIHLVQASNGHVSGDWVGKTRITNGKCDLEYGCAPMNIVTGTNLSLRIELEILGAGAYSGQLVSKNEIRGQIIRFGLSYPLRLVKTE